MSRKRIKIEFEDGQGGRYTISLDGSLSRDKVLKVIDLVELLGPSDDKEAAPISSETAYGKIYRLVEKRFPLGSFLSTDLLEAFEDEYAKPIKLSTIATYLARLHERGLLTRERAQNGWSYRRFRLNQVA